MRKLWLLLALLVATPLGAGDAEPGFVSLFNGKDLTGWRYYKENLKGKTETADKRFTVENGVIVAQEGKGIKDLYTEQDFTKDFVLKMEFRAALKADSGVYVRGPQLQVRDFIRRGEQKHMKKFQNDGWNLLEIVVRNNVLTVNNKALTDKDKFEMTFAEGKATAMLNGKALDSGGLQVRNANVAICTVNGEPLEVMPNVPATGGIGLQAETGKFEFRRVRIKEM